MQQIPDLYFIYVSLLPAHVVIQLLCQDNGVGSPVLGILLTDNESFAFDGVNQLRHGVLILLHQVGQLLLGHGPMIPQQVDEHELLRGEGNLGLHVFGLLKILLLEPILGQPLAYRQIV